MFNSGKTQPKADAAERLKERVKQSKSLCTQTKEETLRMRQQHVG